MEWLYVCLLIFCRLTAFMVASPVFSSRNVPAMFKIGLAATMTWAIHPPFLEHAITVDALYILLVFKEVLVGLLLGFLMEMFFAAAQAAGALMDIQIGFGMANIIDPTRGTQAPLIGSLKSMLLLLSFLLMDGHLHLIKALIRSYEWIPLHQVEFMKTPHMWSDFLIQTFVQAFIAGIQMAAPFVVAMFFTDVGLGLIAKTAPQFNVFVIGVPLKMLIGLSLMLGILVGYSYIFGKLFEMGFGALEKIMTLS